MSITDFRRHKITMVKLDIYLFIATTGSIALLVDY